MTSESTAVQGWPDLGHYLLSLAIRSQLDQIRLVRAALAGVLNHFGVVETDVHSLGLAVTEIINNSMEHGYKGNEDKEIRVLLYIHDSHVEVDIIDDAPPFPEEEHYRLQNDVMMIENPSEQWSMRGHGLQIVREIVDSIDLVTENGQNQMKLRKIVRLQKI
jgi:serine/threonine-protein kinase RsbW